MRVDRAVVDTNVLISAALRSSGRPRRVVDTIRNTNASLLFSDETIDELRTRIQRPKFDRCVSKRLRDAYLLQLLAVSDWVSITRSRLGCRDPDDDKLLETAIMGEADCLVTGDGDLLDMSPFQGVPILTPTQFLDQPSPMSTTGGHATQSC